MTNQQPKYPHYQTVTLSNGLRIVHRQTDSPVMYCGFMVDCGTRSETHPSLYGIAHFVEHILFKGTSTRDAWHINNRMESVGGELNAFTTKEETTYYAIGLNKDFARACDLLCDLLYHPAAPQHELEKECEVVVDEIMSYRDTPSDLVFDEFENQLFANHPLGHNILGSEATVRSFNHDLCLAFIAQHYRSDRMVFFHQGSTPFEKVVRMVEKKTPAVQSNTSSARLEELLSALTPAPANEDGEATPRHQSHVILGTRTYPIGHPNAAALALLNNMLGGPGMNSRLGLELREHRGLVYTVDSSISNFTDCGYLAIYFGCDHHDVERCLRICRNELQKFCDQPLSEARLRRAQKQLCGQLGISMANLESNAIAMAKNLLRLGRVESLAETCQRVQDVNAVQFQQVANQLFNNDPLTTVIIQ